MIKEGILNPQLLRVLGESGHMDWLMLCDAAMPIPTDKERVDLAILHNLPRQLTILKAILNQLQVQKIYMAEEIKEVSPVYLNKVRSVTDQFQVPIEFIPHAHLKEMSDDKNTRACIRTGEETSYSTMILEVGVPYGGDDKTDFMP